jgi:hypothetical protein
MTLLAAALRYAELGYPVFPCAPEAKTPLTEHSHFEATADAERIEAWWIERPNANVAIATTGLVVVDVDAASRWLSDAPERAAELAVAPLSLTANSGRQYVFRQPAGKAWRNTTGRLAEHVDTRADGGYVVVPPNVIERVRTALFAKLLFDAGDRMAKAVAQRPLAREFHEDKCN